MFRVILPGLFVVVPLTAAEPSVTFRTDVLAALSRAGCNQGACHGSPQGKNGFRLSLRGFDPDLDYYLLTKELGGRRIDRLNPDNSLILQKGSGRVQHQGGARFKPGEPAYDTLHAWIAAGAFDPPVSPLTKLDVVSTGQGQERTLTVQASFRDGTTRDVTPLAVFSSSDAEMVPVSPDGRVHFHGTAEAAILVRYLDLITSVRMQYVVRDPPFTFVAPVANNYIDEHVFRKQRELQLNPAAVANDAVFLRRVYLDTIGVLPTAEEAKAFLDSREPDKRAKLIDTLLNRDEYASLWALKWADVLRGNPASISERGVHSFHRYLVKTMADDRPMTEFAKELLTSLGNTLHKPAANFFRVARTPEEAAENAAQLFMGVRVGCAKCHNHPFESITQTDYYGLAAFFARVQFKGNQFGLDDEIVYLQPNREIQHPRTRKNQEPVAFGTTLGKLDPDDDRRPYFVEWLTKPNNKYFAASLVNRVWFHLMGRGIVDPVDDFRDTNPPSNPQLLQALTEDFARNGYRLKPLIRSILRSHTYQLASHAPAQSRYSANADRYFVKAHVRMLPAEQILDAVSSATGVPETFKGYPLGTRALELAEGGVHHPFLQAFAKPVRDVSCECAREEDPSLPQILHLLNNSGLVAKVKSPKGRIADWVKQNKETTWIVEHIYLSTLSRRPTEQEQTLIRKHLDGLADRTTGLHDLQYALLNLNEFLLRH